jgi:hypothetical protein
LEPSGKKGIFVGYCSPVPEVPKKQKHQKTRSTKKPEVPENQKLQSRNPQVKFEGVKFGFSEI